VFSVFSLPAGDDRPAQALEDGLNQKLRDLIRLLGEAIHESVSDSDRIAGVVRDIRSQGFDVLLMLEATIGLNEVTETDEAEAGADIESRQGPFTPHDLNFLKSLRISMSGEPADADTLDQTLAEEDADEDDDSSLDNAAGI
jgi:hypothetical protein